MVLYLQKDIMTKPLLKSVLVIFCVTLLFACQPESKVVSDSFTVSGTIKGLDTEYMSYGYRNAEGKRVFDSVFVENESFTYTGKFSEPGFIIFWPNVESTMKRTGRGYYPAKSSQFAFLASPGDNITFEGEITDFVDAYPTGTPANDDLASINRRIFPLLNKAVNLQLRIDKLEDADPLKQVLADSVSDYNSQVDGIKEQFVTSHPTSQAAIWYLSDMMVRSQVTQEKAISIFKSFDSSLKDYTYYKEVAMRVEGIESTLIGKTMPNFVTNLTMDGSDFELNSLRGKHVLIDFWGTWCGPCIAEMPKVKEYQQKYKDELVILGVNSGDTKEKILKFMEPKGYDWKQVLAGDGDESLVLKLNVAGFPTKFILSPEGEILHRFVGDTEEAFDVLDEILQ
ncbi:MAG: TlpA disulfide reductase family protein [Roseivirga sp.]